MGEATPIKEERNEQLKQDYLAGTSIRDLIIKYDISVSRIYALLKYMGVKTTKEKGGGENGRTK